MARAIAGVVVGYLAMFLVVFVGLSGAFLALGVERTFQPGSYEVTLTWIMIWLAVSAIAALAGGYVCVSIARGGRAPVVLAVLVLVLGLLLAMPALGTRPEDAPGVRGAEVGNLQAMQNAREPWWVALANPVIGAAGVLGGARRGRSRAAAC